MENIERVWKFQEEQAQKQRADALRLKMWAADHKCECFYVNSDSASVQVNTDGAKFFIFNAKGEDGGTLVIIFPKDNKPTFTAPVVNMIKGHFTIMDGDGENAAPAYKLNGNYLAYALFDTVIFEEF